LVCRHSPENPITIRSLGLERGRCAGSKRGSRPCHRAPCDPSGFAIIKIDMNLAATHEAGTAIGQGSNLQQEFEALISGCGIRVLEEAHMSLAGRDRVRWLNGMITNNVRDLQPGHGVYAFVLNPQGHIQADLYAYQQGERFVVETERAQLETVIALFRR